MNTRRLLFAVVLLLSGSIAFGQTGNWGNSGSHPTYTNGKVGIGTSSPSSLLHLVSGSGFSQRFERTGAYAGYTDLVYGVRNSEKGFFIDNNGAGINRLSILHNGNVGIGIVDANTGFHLKTTNSLTDLMLITKYDNETSQTTTPFRINYGGQVEILNRLLIGDKSITSGVNNNFKLSVDGKVVAKEVIVTQQNWADFVFEDDFDLKPLNEVEAFINENNHLPGVPTTKAIIEAGNDLGKTDAILLQKIEELTLYVIELSKENKAQKSELEKLSKGLKLLKQ